MHLDKFVLIIYPYPSFAGQKPAGDWDQKSCYGLNKGLEEKRFKLDYEIRNIAEFAKKFCVSDGNLAPYFQAAEKQWIKLAAGGQVLADFQI